MGRKLPESWEFKNFEDVVEILDNKRKPVSKSERNQKIGSIPYYGSTGQAGTINDYIFNEELVLLGEDGADFIKKDKDVAYLISGKSWVNNHAHVLKGKNGLSNKWLCYFLNSIDYSNKVAGATRMKLNQAEMKKIKILFPKTEQQKIVDYLDKQFGFIDNMEKEVDEYENKLNVLEKGILEEAFSEFNKSTKVKLGTLFDITSSKRIYESDYVSSGIPFYRSKEIIEKSQNQSISINLFISNEKFEEIKSKYGVPKKGDILITAVGTLGIPYIVKDEAFYFKDGNLLWLKNKGIMDQKFLIYLLKSPFFRKFIDNKKGGAVYSALTIQNLKGFEIYSPNLTTQKQIAYKLDKQFEIINSTRIEIKKQQENLKQLRKAILNDIFGGFEE